MASDGLIYPERDLVYLGAFRVPAGELGGSSWSYGGASLCHCPVGDRDGPDDGFPGSLFGTGHPYQSYVSEIDIPAPVVSPRKRIDDLPIARTLQPFADVTGGRQTGGLTGTVLGDIQYYAGDPGNEGLYWVMYEYYLPPPDAAWFGWCRLDLSDPQPRGTWRLDGFPAAATSRYLFDIPREWADRYAPGLYLAAGRFRVVNGGSWGPALYAFAPWSDSAPPPGTELMAVELLKYDRDHALTHFSNSDEWNDGAWITACDREAVIFVGTKALRTRASGLEYYGDPGVDGCGYKGYHGEPYYGAILFYDPWLLGKVAEGVLKPWQVQPYAIFNVEDILFRQGCRRSILGGVAYDRGNRLLYLVEMYADGRYARRPIVHVFRVVCGSGGPDTEPPTPPSGLRIGDLSPTEVRIAWDRASDDVHLVGYVVYRDGEPIATTTETVFRDDKVNPGATYTYTVRAWDSRANMSEPSSLTVTTPLGEDSRGPVISSVRIMEVSSEGVTVSWHTDEPATTRVEYGIRGETTRVYEDRALTTEHIVHLTDLTPGKEYVFRASSTDASGNFSTYAWKSFVTPYPGKPGGFPPVLDGIGAKRVYEGETLRFGVSAEDPDSEVLRFEARDLPPGAEFDPQTGRFAWAPKQGEAGVYRITFRVSDGHFSDEEEVVIFVLPRP